MLHRLITRMMEEFLRQASQQLKQKMKQLSRKITKRLMKIRRREKYLRTNMNLLQHMPPQVKFQTSKEREVRR